MPAHLEIKNHDKIMFSDVEFRDSLAPKVLVG